jgi:aspartate kinase
MIVIKFGGTSVSQPNSPQLIQQILESRSEACVVVVSAFSGVTNSLVDIVELLKVNKTTEEALNQLQDRHEAIATKWQLGHPAQQFIQEQFTALKTHISQSKNVHTDFILGAGERLSSFLLWQKLNHQGVQIKHADATVLIVTEQIAGELCIAQPATNEAICNGISQTAHTLVGGFICSDVSGEARVLGRGGSDHSATLFGAALGARRVDIYTDVNGVMTCDPRLVATSKLVTDLTYKEAAELSFFGAKVLHPLTMNPCIAEKIPIRVRSTFNQTSTGTLISAECQDRRHFKALALRKNVSIVNIYSKRMLGAIGFLKSVFAVFEKFETAIDVVTTSEVSVSMTIDKLDRVDEIIAELETFGRCTLTQKMAIISAVGEGLRDTEGLSAVFFSALRDVNIRMISLGASDVNLSIVVRETEAEKAITQLHQVLFEGAVL